MGKPLRALGRTALPVLLGLVAATCTDQPSTAPGGGFAARVQVAPTFGAGAFLAGLPLDQVQVTVVRPAAETLLVRTAPFPADSAALALELPVELLAPSESLDVTVDLLSGATALFHGTRRVEVQSGAAGTAPAIPMTFVGPGSQIGSLVVAPRDSVLGYGDTLTFAVAAYDSGAAAVGTFYVRWSSSLAAAPIRADGRLIAPAGRGVTWVAAATPTGIRDSTRITFVPVPTSVAAFGGNAQSDTVGDTLAAPLVVLVKAADGLPVQGVPVTFAAVTAGASVVTPAAVTDSLGHASTVAVLGASAGTQSFTATVAGLPAVTFTATAGVATATAIAKAGGDAQSDTATHTLATPLTVLVTDAFANPVAGAQVAWTRTYGSGTLSADTVVTDAAGHAQVSYTLGAPGTDSVEAQLVGTSAFVTFTATAVAGSYTIVEVSGNGQADTVARTLPLPMVAEVRFAGTSTPAPGVMVHWSILYGGGSLSVDSSLTDSLGRAQATYTLDTLSGSAEVMAEPPTAGEYVTFQVEKLPGAPVALGFAVAPPDTVRAGVPIVPAPAVRLHDGYGNVVPAAGLMMRAATPAVAAAPPQLAAGGIRFSASVSAGDSAVTDSTGTATFTGLALAGSVGPEELDFTVDSLAVPALVDSVIVAPGDPWSVIPFGGDGQTAYVDSLVAVAPQALVVDSSGNGVPGVSVAFVVTGGGGSVTGDTVVTDSLGYATVGSWRMGPAPGTNTLEARVAGASSGTFTATAQPLTPTIQLALLGTSVVGVGRTASLEVRLSTPAPAGGVVVSLASDAPGVVDVDSASLTVAQGDSVRTAVLSGYAEGTAAIVASASGYDPDTLVVTGSLNLITLPTTANVALGQTASLPVQLAQPAPAGGVVVTLTSLDPTRVALVTPTVTFNAGEQLKNATVSGVAVGTAAVVAENANFAPDTALVSTTAALNITATSLSAYSTFGAQFTTEFRSAGNLTPAPAGGITVTLTPRDPTCVAAPATTLIPQGQTSVSDSLDYGGSATLPCVTYLVASAPGIDSDSVQVTINPPPAASFAFTTTEVGAGLQAGAYGVNLAVSAHGGRLVSVVSLDTTKVLVQRDNVTAGSDSVGVFLPNGTGSTNFWVAGHEGVVNDSALVVVRVPGFLEDTAKVYVRQAAYDLQGVPGSVNVLGGNANVYVEMGIGNPANTGMNAYQGPRAGGTLGRLATVTLSSSTVAQLRDSTATPDSVKTATFPVGQYYTPTSLPNGLQIDPIGVGTVTVTASVPGLVALPAATRTMTVQPATITFGGGYAEVGSGLQSGTYSVGLSGGNHGGITVQLRLLSSGVALLQPDNATAGTDSLALTYADGVTSQGFWLAGVEGVTNDSALVEASAPGFVPDTFKIYVRQPAFDLQGVPGTTGSLSGNSNIYVEMGIGNPSNTGMNAYQGPRVGGSIGRVASVSVTPGTVALLRDSTATPDSTKTVTVPVGQYYSPTSLPQGLQLDPLAPGTVTVTATLPGFVPLPNATRTMTVTGPALSLASSAEVGSGLQSGAYSASLGASNHGGVTLTLRTATPGVAVLQPDNATPGSDTLQFAIPDGTSSANFWLAGLEGITSDSVLVIAEIPGFTPDTMKVYVRRPAFELANVPASTTTLSANTNIWVQMGVPNAAFTSINAWQGSRAGGTAPTFVVRSDVPTVVRMADSATVADSFVITLPAGQYYSPTSVASGGLAVDPLTTGTAQIVATHPVFLALAGATRTVTVATPGITVNGGTVGAGLQRSQSFTLGAPQHGGVNVVVKSTAPGVVKVAPDALTPGTDSIVIPLANGFTSGSFYIQGMEGQTGSPTIQVSAAGFSDGSAGVTVVLPAIELGNAPANIAAGAADQAFWAQVGVPNGTTTAMNEYQNLRAGGVGPVTVTFTNATGGVAQLVTTALTGDTVTAQIPVGSYYTPTSVATGGVAFDPLATGTTTLTAAAAGFLALPAATKVVNVTP
ncbi:MAG TPA: Ig-like domain-containing protein [Gemmatimonadales bacterium]|nr:Ig-like domain-containing protein [Gemmatimonadales bacterium]